MTIKEAIRQRHSVRKYKDQPIPEEIRQELLKEIELCNQDGSLNIQLLTDEPKAFSSFMASYGKFSGVSSYIALVGWKTSDLDEMAGYYGQKLVLKAQQLGLNTCWVAVSFSKRKCKAKIRRGEKMVCVIALGYGVNQGVPRKSKPMQELCEYEGEMPDWFSAGMEAAMLAPTAVNQQKFTFRLQVNKVAVQTNGGFYAKIDLGIVKYHFEIGAGQEKFEWV